MLSVLEANQVTSFEKSPENCGCEVTSLTVCPTFLNRAVYSKSQSKAPRINIGAVVRANVLSAIAVHLLKIFMHPIQTGPNQFKLSTAIPLIFFPGSGKQYYVRVLQQFSNSSITRGFRLDNVLFHSDSTGRRPTCKTNRIHDEMWRFRDDAQGQQDVSECHKSPRFEYLKLIWYKLSSYVIIVSVRLT